MLRLNLTRADFIGLLIEQHADMVEIPVDDQRYRRLRSAVNALGGSLDYRKFNGPRGAAWILGLGEKRVELESSDLDGCYRSSREALEQSLGRADEIDLGGFIALFERLAAS